MRSLRWRFILPVVVLLAVTLSGLSLFLSSYVRDSYLTLWRSSLTAETRLVASEVEPFLQSVPPFHELNQAADRLSGQLNVRITVILPNGTVAADTEADQTTMENHLNRPEVKAALNGLEATEVRNSGTLSTEMLYSAVPVYSAGQIAGAARLSVSLAQIGANLATIQRVIAGVTFLSILLATVLTYLLTSYTIRPLERLTSAAQRMSSGNFTETIPSESLDEIGLLNRAFNSMGQQLNTKITELETERSKLASVLANMTDGVLIIAADGSIELINPAAANLFHTTVDEAQGHTLIGISRQHQLVDVWHKCIDTGKQQSITLETGIEKLFMHCIATPLGSLLPGTTLLLLQDLTRIRRLETVRRDFVSNVSHELRTPLASLKALAETLQEGALEDPPAARRFLSQMETEIDNLTQMVRELLELSRIESGRVPLEKSRIAPEVIAAGAVERMKMQADRSGLAMALEIPGDLPEVYADRGRMEQVLVNLLHNAIKFTPPGGQITVSLRRESGWVIFQVKDSGVGISPEALPRIFERFYKADRARSGGGTGLGLSIARHLVEAHGGRIWAESAPSEGSTFFISLPAV